MSNVHRIAMWSGPRNISTAMMRSWGNRPDTVVCDEPFYANYLMRTGYTHHPSHQEVVDQHETDCDKIVAWLTGPLPESKRIFYQKQMAHHMLPHIPLDWTDQLTNVFLIRDPREMLLSLMKFFPNPTIEETGLPQQIALLEREQSRTGNLPPVLDSRDVLLNPHAMLEQLCDRIGIQFDPCMLSWEPGLHPTDGNWGRHWYVNVANSTGFTDYQPRMGEVPAEHQELLAKCQKLYEQLAAHKIKP